MDTNNSSGKNWFFIVQSLPTLKYCFIFLITFVALQVMYLGGIFTQITLILIKNENCEIIYDIDTVGCKIVQKDPFDKEAMKYFKEMKNVHCGKKPFFISYNDTHMVVDRKKVKEYKPSWSNSLNCYYKKFWRIPRDSAKNKQNQNLVQYGKKIYFNGSTRINEGYVWVGCDVKKKRVYEDFYYFFNETKERKKINESLLNVIIFGIDAVSRHNFERRMPLTRNYLLNELDAIEFLGYNKIGLNSFPNLFAMFTGYTSEEKKNCHHKTYVDNCSYIWEDFKKNGYKTVYAEDMSRFGTFTYYEKKGFINQPTDYYWNTFSSESERGHYYYVKECCCIRNRFSFRYITDYSLKVIKHLRNLGEKYFSFFWSSSLSHDTVNYCKTGDETHENYLKQLHHLGVLKNSILILMADHGSNKDYMKTTYGRFETKLPMLFISLPESFKRSHPEAVRTMKLNTRKLITVFDIHKTLEAISQQDFSTHPTEFNRSTSLFRPIPSNRTCKTLGISPHFCSCHDTISQPINITNHTIYMANYFVKLINKKTKKHKKCARFTLHNITKAMVVNLGEKHYTINILTKPGLASFEASLLCEYCDNATNFYFPEITRTNTYSTQSQCINDSFIKPYCVCK